MATYSVTANQPNIYLLLLYHPIIQNFGQLIVKSTFAILANLLLVFAVGIPISFDVRDKDYGTLIRLVTFTILSTR
ncbi:MAG: hypothetical protein ACSLEL_02755 [Candidatus Malihini olakiniferum]